MRPFIAEPESPRQPDERRSGRLPCAGMTCQFGPVADLSRGGVKVVSRKALRIPEGESVNLKLTSQGLSVTLPARPAVCRKRPDGKHDIGFQFLELSDEQSQALTDLVRTSLHNHHCVKRSA